MMTLPDIHVDDEVFATLHGKAQPFVDTPNSVLRREPRPRGRASGDFPGDEPKQPAVMGALAATAGHAAEEVPAVRQRPLLAHGGAAEMAAVLPEVLGAMEAGGVLVEADHLPVSTGEIRSRNAAHASACRC